MTIEFEKINKLKRQREEQEMKKQVLYDNVHHFYYNAQGELDVASFIEEHKNDNILFVRGGAVGELGYCDCQLLYKNMNQKISYTDISTKNPTCAMLYGILNICNTMIDKSAALYIISSTKLGFRNGNKDDGPNKGKVREILKICKDKKIALNEVVLFHDGKTIKDIINQ